MIKSGIYSIINKVNGKRYIGSSKNIKERWRVHKWRLKENKHHSPHLQNSFNIDPSVIEYEIVEEVIELSFLEKREQYWVDFYKSYLSDFGYNAVRTVSRVGPERMKERWAKPGAKEKQSKRMKEVCSTKEHRKKLSLGHLEYFKDPKNRELKKLACPHRKMVRCIESGRVFQSISEAAKELSVSVVKIRDSASGKRKSNGGMSFEWVLDV